VAWGRRELPVRSQAEPSPLGWGDTGGQKGKDNSEGTCNLYHVCTWWQKGARNTSLLFPGTTAKSDRDTSIQLPLLLTSSYCELERIHLPPSAQGQEDDMLCKQHALMK